MKKIVIFGASGDIGKYLVDYFIEHSKKKYEIVAVGTRRDPFFVSLNIPYYQVDITKKEQFEVLPSDVYAVIDLAGIMPAKMKGYEPQKYIDVNISGTLNILNYCVKNNVDRIVYSQSFGDIKDYGDELLVLSPYLPRKFSYNSDHTVYVLTKNFSVDLMENYYKLYGLKRFVIRLPNIYMYSKNGETFYVDGVPKKVGFRAIIESAIKGEPIEIWGDKNRKKDMIYVKDLCQILFNSCFAKSNGGIFNAGTGIGITLEDQIKGIVDVFCSPNNKSEILEAPKKVNAPQ